MEAAGEVLIDLDRIEHQLEELGGDVRAIRALEESVDTVKRDARTREGRIAAMVAKVKIARYGGRALLAMAERGERLTRHNLNRARWAQDGDGRPASRRELGLTHKRVERWLRIARLSDEEYGVLERRERAHVPRPRRAVR